MENPNPQKPAQTAETSLKFMAWDIKTIGQEIKNLNVTIQALTEMLARHLRENKLNLPPKKDEIPF